MLREELRQARLAERLAKEKLLEVTHSSVSYPVCSLYLYIHSDTLCRTLPICTLSHCYVDFLICINTETLY